MSYKSLNDVESVIALGKPIEVVDMFLESYLQGVEYDKWLVGKDLEADVYEPVDVSLSVVQWKKDNYSLLRESEYPSWKEFADAYVKDDVVGMDAYKAKCLAVKVKYPK